MRSSPKRICGFITPSEARTSPSARFARCPAIVVEPMSSATPSARSCSPGQTPVIDAAVVDRDGDAVVAGLERRLERRGSRSRSASRPVERPTPARAPRAGGARSPPGLARSGRSTSTSCSRTTGSMTKSRTGTPLRTTWRWTWLSGGTSTRTSPSTCARQPSRRPGARPAQPVVLVLVRAARREVAVARLDAVLREAALGRHDLAAAAQAAAAADRVEVDAERARRVEDRRPGLEPPAPPGRREDDLRAAAALIAPCRRSRAMRRCRPARPRRAWLTRPRARGD